MKKSVAKKHPAHKNPSTSFRLSEKTRERLTKMAEKMEYNQTHVVETAVRVFAERNGIEV